MSKLQSVFLKLKSLKKRTYIIIGGCILAAVAAVLSIAIFSHPPYEKYIKIIGMPISSISNFSELPKDETTLICRYAIVENQKLCHLDGEYRYSYPWSEESYLKNENITSVLWHSVNGNYTEKDMQRLIKMLSRTYGHYVNTYEEDDNKYTDFDRLTYQWFDDSLSVDLWAILDRDNHKKINSLHISWEES